MQALGRRKATLTELVEQGSEHMRMTFLLIWLWYSIPFHHGRRLGLFDEGMPMDGVYNMGICYGTIWNPHGVYSGFFGSGARWQLGSVDIMVYFCSQAIYTLFL